MSLFYILATIFFTVYGQIILKWRIDSYGSLPDGIFNKIVFLFTLLLDPFILSGFISAFVASFFWMAALTRIELSVAYPFMSLNFVIIMFLSYWMLNEPLTMQKVVSLSLIVTGVILGASSS